MCVCQVEVEVGCASARHRWRVRCGVLPCGVLPCVCEGAGWMERGVEAPVEGPVLAQLREVGTLTDGRWRRCRRWWR